MRHVRRNYYHVRVSLFYIFAEIQFVKFICIVAYAKGFPLDEKLDSIVNFLEPYGPIDSCMRRTVLDKATKQQRFKGSCFIIFKDVETCKKFIEKDSIKFNDTELIRKWKKDYIEGKKQQIQERNKSKQEQRNKILEAEKKFDLPKGALLHFTGIEKGQTLTREEIKAKIKEVGDIDKSFVDFNEGDLEGHVRLSVENAAIEFYKKLNDGQLEIGDIKLKFRVLEGDEEEEFLKKAVNFMTQIRQNKKTKGIKRKGHFTDNKQKKKADKE